MGFQNRQKPLLPKRNTTIRKKIRKRKTRSFLQKFFRISLPKKETLNFKKIILIVVGSLAGIFMVFTIFSPFFWLRDIEVIRDTPEIEIEEIQNILKEFKNKNLWSLRESSISQKIQTEAPDLEVESVIRKFPRTLEVRLKQVPAVANLLNKNTAIFSVLGKNGIITKTDASEEGVPIIEILQVDKDLVRRQLFLSPEQIEKIFLGKKKLEAIGVPVLGVQLLKKAREVHYIIKYEGSIWVDLQESVEVQIKKLEVSLKKLKFHKRRFHHLDLRIPNHIFWEEQ